VIVYWCPFIYLVKDKLLSFIQLAAMKLKMVLSSIELFGFVAYSVRNMETKYGSTVAIAGITQSDRCELNEIDALDETENGIKSHDRSQIVMNGVIESVNTKCDRGDRSFTPQNFSSIRTKSFVNAIGTHEYGRTNNLTTSLQQEKIVSNTNTDTAQESVNCDSQNLQTDGTIPKISCTGKVYYACLASSSCNFMDVYPRC